MTIGEFEERIAPMKEKYPFTDKETGIKLLEKSNKRTKWIIHTTASDFSPARH